MAKPTPIPETLTADETAAILGVQRSTVFKLWRKGELEGFKTTLSVRAPLKIYPDSVRAYRIKRGERIEDIDKEKEPLVTSQ